MSCLSLDVFVCAFLASHASVSPRYRCLGKIGREGKRETKLRDAKQFEARGELFLKSGSQQSIF